MSARLQSLFAAVCSEAHAGIAWLRIVGVVFQAQVRDFARKVDARGVAEDEKRPSFSEPRLFFEFAFDFFHLSSILRIISARTVSISPLVRIGMSRLVFSLFYFGIFFYNGENFCPCPFRDFIGF